MATIYVWLYLIIPVSSDVLLCHDDELEGRRIAFILYLTEDEWNESDGGTLDLFSVDGIVRKIISFSSICLILVKSVNDNSITFVGIGHSLFSMPIIFFSFPACIIIT